MNTDAPLPPLAGPAAWGIDHGYIDAHGTWQDIDPDTARALVAAMSGDPDDPASAPPPATTRVLRRGVADEATGAGTVILEDGTERPVRGLLPADLPLGYHRFHPEDDSGATHHLIVAPPSAPRFESLRTWGPTVQLYAARSTTSWGMGDLADLGTLVTWSRRHGAGVVGLNPLHADTPKPHPADSPYSPSSRRWRSPLYLAVEQIDGAELLPDLAERIAAGRRLNDEPRIDRTAVWEHKLSALRAIWSRTGGGPDLAAYRRTHGDDLEQWARFCVLAEQHGPDWRAWPDALRRPDAPAVHRAADDRPDDVAFWAWLQLLLDRQLEASGADDMAIADLAVGFDPAGADAWACQDLLALDVHIGAPPDLLGPDGQDWGLPPFIPWRLRDAGYQPFAATIRACLSHARGIRIDHVMGLFRLFWIPPGRGAAQGAYVRSHAQDLLAVVALEAHRADALVVGEDLGTVEPVVRDHLADAGVLSTRLLWFEDEAPAHWPRRAMAAITTHDLPTVAGVWSGTDLADQVSAGVTVPADGDAAFRHHLRVAAGVDDSAEVDHVIRGAYRSVADAPSMLVTAALDDLVGAERRPNLPGTIDQHPNWRIPLPVPVDDLDAVPLAVATAEILRAPHPAS